MLASSPVSLKFSMLHIEKGGSLVKLIYHLRDVGVEATWSVVRANMTQHFLMAVKEPWTINYLSIAINDCSANKSPLLWALN
jgi:hypothetical protein